jgi:putative FmdB family regulatory protein
MGKSSPEFSGNDFCLSCGLTKRAGEKGEVKEMPIYEYRCPSCGGTSEIWEGVGTRKDSLECKHCGERNVERILSLSHPVKNPRPKGSTCCGRQERCSTPPCSSGGTCHKD